MNKKIAILAVGSRGDVQPFVALSRGLQAAGHEIILCAPEQFADFAADYNLPFAPLSREFLALMDTSSGQTAFESRRSGLALIKLVKPIMRDLLDGEWAAARDAGAVVYHPKALGGYHIAEKLGVPGIASMPLPNTPTSAFPNPVLPPATPGFLNRASYRVDTLARAPFAGVVNTWREEVLGLPGRSRLAAETKTPDGRPVPTLYSYSQYVVPDPPDWPPEVTATGYWFLDQHDGWQPPADLLAFLEAGPPPVYVGFGSMTSGDPRQKARLVVDALQRAGQRGVLAKGWGGLAPADVPDTICLIDQAPHDWLFPRVAAVVHHGGAGTTAAGLRAGKPTLIAPFFGDQPFWGRRVHELGVGPQPIPQKKLTVDNLAAAITQAAGDADMRRRAAALGGQIQAEDGVARAVAIIESYL